MKFKVELARIVRETRVVVVEAPNEAALNDDVLGDLYDIDDDLGEWKEDSQWGCEEGTHQVIPNATITQDEPATLKVVDGKCSRIQIKVNAVALNETSVYNFKKGDRAHIKGIHSVYAYNPASCTNLCELTPSYELRYLYTYIEHEGEVSEEIRGELDERYCNEPTDDTYIHCRDVEKLTTKECGEYDNMDAAVEHLRSNWPI